MPVCRQKKFSNPDGLFMPAIAVARHYKVEKFYSMCHACPHATWGSRGRGEERSFPHK